MILLGLLLDGELSGYDLRSAMNNSTGHFYRPSFGSIYPWLRQHEAKGLVSGRDEPVGRKARRLWSIEDNGREMFLEWLATPPTRQDLNYSCEDILVKFYFFRYLPAETSLGILRGLNLLVATIMTELTGYGGGGQECPPDSRSWPLDYGYLSYGALLQWTNRAIRALTGDEKS
jgi:DNA-binding PadR family transcriptional regulator